MHGQHVDWIGQVLLETHHAIDQARGIGVAQHQAAGRRAREAFLDRVVEQLAEWVEVAVHVEQADRRRMATDDQADEGLEELLVGAEAARQHKEGLGARLKQRLALAHAGHDDEFIAALPALLELQELFRDDADDRAAGVLRRSRDRAHQTDAAAAIDEREPAAREFAADLASAGLVAGIPAERTAAVDGDGGDGRRHEGKVVAGPIGCWPCGSSAADGGLARGRHSRVPEEAQLSWLPAKSGVVFPTMDHRRGAVSVLTIAVAAATAAGQGQVVGWGDNSAGQLAPPPPSLLRYASMSVGGYHAMTRLADGSIRCLGSNIYGQLSVPLDLPPVAIQAAGSDHCIVVLADGTLRAWGDDFFGQCQVPLSLGPVRDAACGEFHTVAVRTDGGIVCWGENGAGQCAVPIAPLGASSGLDVSLIDADGDGDRDIVSVQRTVGTQSAAVLMRIDTTGSGGPLTIGEETDLGANAPILSTRGDLDGVGGEDLFLVDQASSFMGGSGAAVAKPYLGDPGNACPADIDGDGQVGGADLGVLLS